MNPKLKKALKITGISLGSLIALLIIAAVIISWVIVTPKRLTPIVRSQLKNYITCQADLKEVELTIFSTFPQIALRIDGLTLINPTPGTDQDTLLASQSVDAELNLKALLFHNKVLVDGVTIRKAKIAAFADSTGRTNFDIFKESDPKKESEPFDLIALKSLKLEESDVSFNDYQNGYFFDAKKLDLKLQDLEMTPEELTAMLKLKSPDLYFKMGEDIYWDHRDMDLSLDAGYHMESGKITIQDLQLNHQKNRIEVDGTVESNPDGDMVLNLDYALQTDSIRETIALIPLFLRESLDGIEMEGKGELKGKVSGIFNDSLMPLITGELKLKEFVAYLEGMENIVLREGVGNFNYHIDLNQEDESRVQVNEFKFNTLDSKFEMKGLITELFDAVRYNGNLKADLHLPTLSKEFAEPEGYQVNGKMALNTQLNTTLDDLTELNLDKLLVQGNLKLERFSLIGAKDTLFFETPDAQISLRMNQAGKDRKKQFLEARISSSQMKGTMGKSIDFNLDNANLHVDGSNFTDSLQLLKIACEYQIGHLRGRMDSDNAELSEIKGKASIEELRQLKQNLYNIDLKASQIAATTGEGEDKMDIAADAISLKFNIHEKYSETNPLLQWNPVGNIQLTNGKVKMASIPETIYIPTISFIAEKDEYRIKESKIILGESDFSLIGTLSNLQPYLKNEGILHGDFQFISTQTDINRIMDLTSAESGSEEVDLPPTPRAEGDPFLVPLNMNVKLNTRIDQALFNGSIIRNIKGDLYVKDGKLILDGLKATLPGSDVVVTALYRTPRKNHLFIGVDYHMLNVEIENLLTMFPDIDTMMPMLKSFKGKGEFHFVAETYLFSNYDLKKSTIRGAAAISGQDLVLMDGETFTEISKILMFNKKTENKIDSIAAEFTLFKNEIDVYPFSIKMDKYRAVISGKHNLDMSFIYHISLVESPILISVGVDVSGTLDDLKIRPVIPRYAEYFRPARSEAFTNEQYNLKKMIREALLMKLE